MLGSASNWSSLAKNLCKNTGRTIIIYDARNHGKSGHTENMSYMDMSEDLKQLIEEGQEVPLTNPKSAILVGHSMGGRTCMYTALSFPNLVEAMVVVDISPINQKFNLEDGSDWNMDHFFHALKAVRFLQPSDIENWTIYKVTYLVKSSLTILRPPFPSSSYIRSGNGPYYNSNFFTQKKYN